MTKFRTPHDKSSGDIRVIRMFLQIIMTVYSKHTGNINLNGAKINASPLKLETRYAVHSILTQYTA